MKIAVHQMCSGIDIGRNLDVMMSGIWEAVRAGSEAYFAPEMSLLLDRDRNRARTNITSESASDALRALCVATAEAGIWVHIGSMPVVSDTDPTRFANRTLVIGPDGEIRARYDKIHLFDVQLASGENWRESSAYVPGSAPALVETPFGQMGLTICYDMRFPDLFANLARAGADILAVPAAFTVPTGKAHWHTLLRARAIEAEAYVVAAAQSGTHEDGRATYGHSLVIDPWGEILLDMGEGEGIGFAEIDLGRIAEVRAQIPVHANRRDIVDEPIRF